MHLMLFDYSGTLDRLPDPVAFVQALKRRHPEAKVVMHTGTEMYRIDEAHPGLIEAMDDVWLKPYLLADKIIEHQVTELTVVDDDEKQRWLANRGARILTPGSVHIQGVDALERLRQELNYDPA